MRRWIVVVAMGAAFTAVAADQLSFDFSSLDPTYWNTLNSDGLWTVGAVGGELHVAHATSANPDNRVGGVASRFGLLGDFEAKVSYRIVMLPRPGVSGQEGNQLKLHVTWAGAGFLSERSSLRAGPGGNNFIEDSWWHVGAGGGLPGYRAVSSSDLTGQLRLVRTGNSIEGFAWDSGTSQWTSLGSHDFSTGLGIGAELTLSLEGYNNQSDDQVDVYFDNLWVQADQILLVPEPSAGAGTAAALALFSLLRWRPGRRV